jgi:general secretion pathway protein K
MKRVRAAPSDAGVALATVLVMATVMAMLAVLVVDAARFSLRRTQNQASLDQARWYLIGAEDLALRRLQNVLDAMRQAQGAAAMAVEDWQAKPLVFPLDDGAISLTLHEGGNCFNVNAMVEAGEDGQTRASYAAQVQFARLIDLAEVRGVDGAALAAGVADYLDGDQIALPGGGEDDPDGRPGAYRTADTLIADLGELLEVPGMTAPILARLAPSLCVRPTALINPLNVNTLTLEQAPVLASTLGGQFSLGAARTLIAARPPGGWVDVDAFFAAPQFFGAEITSALKAQFSVQSRYFVLVTRVQYRGMDEAAAALIEAGGRPLVVRRVFGVGVNQRSV